MRARKSTTSSAVLHTKRGAVVNPRFLSHVIFSSSSEKNVFPSTLRASYTMSVKFSEPSPSLRFISPFAAFRQFALSKNFVRCTSCVIMTSPRIPPVKSTRLPFSKSVFITPANFFAFAVISSPTAPSPRVTARVKIPCAYCSSREAPSSLYSTRYSG